MYVVLAFFLFIVSPYCKLSRVTMGHSINLIKCMQTTHCFTDAYDSELAQTVIFLQSTFELSPNMPFYIEVLAHFPITLRLRHVNSKHRYYYCVV